MAKSHYLTKPEETSGLPRGVKYIIGNEAAERFSFYGMRTILVVFMTRYLHYMVDGQVGAEMSKAEANEYYHNFVAATYFFPVLGSILSDIFVGKYRTILWLSIVYCGGHLALALMGGAGIAPATWLVLGLFLIAFGSGGIKPCVSAHVGDQFGKKNSHLMSKVFQWFYFSINFGSTVSTALTPWLLKWYGPHVAFGIPGILMALATLLFWMGRNVFIHVPPGGAGFFRETFSREGVSALLKLSLIYAFVAVFWGLFDQTGSSWVLQAENMDRRFLGVNWLEAQIQVINPILVLVLIPLFQFVVYPGVNRFFTLTAIRKMSIGFFLTTGSFALIMLAQELIDRGETPSIAWQLWAYVLLTAGEVMISITGLEFSYTQAPKTMKSVIMAVWLLSVSLGNIFTSYVNHQIQTPGVNQVAAVVKDVQGDGEHVEGSWTFRVEEAKAEAEAEKPGRLARISGYDGKFGTSDDITLSFNAFHQLESVETSENEAMNAAAELIDKAFFDSSAADPQLPSDDEGARLLAGLGEANGAQYVYKLLSKNNYRILVAGPDQQLQTQWDVVLLGSVSRAASADNRAAAEAPYDWLEQRIIEIRGDEGKAEVDAARGAIPETVVNHDITVGGQDTLEGAAYFRFWTIAILITALLFVPVGFLYQERSYIQSDEDAEASAVETT
ncbi:MAG: POT family MFS transporter [Planctomycetales bacterium]|nr:POT family MFS transporter [Planctomycetales bacterium]